MDIDTAHLAAHTHGTSPLTRLAAIGVIAGTGFLLGRTIVLMAGGALQTYSWWAAALLLVEFVIDGFALLAGVRWLVTNRTDHGSVALRVVAAMILVHALRVVVFVMGRTGPWVDLDVRPDHRVDYAEAWTWPEVCFAGASAAMSIVVLIIIWRRRRTRRASGRLSSEA